MKRVEYQFDLWAVEDSERQEMWALASALQELLPHADVTLESVKTDTMLLRITVETPTEKMA
jgi:hypothetical protein